MPARCVPAPFDRFLGAVLAALLIAALAPALATPAHAQSPEERTLFVAPSGSDSARGTAEQPWRTLDHAFRQLKPGDTLLVRGGTYREQVTRTPYTPASPSAPIVVKAHPGERPVLQGLLNIRFADHWTFDGLNVHWDDAVTAPEEPLVKIMDGVGWAFRNAEVAGARSYAGVYIGTTKKGEPAHWRLEGNCIRDTRGVHPPYQDHNVYVQNGLSAAQGTIERNVIFNAPNGTNIKLGAGPGDHGASRVDVRYNTLFAGAHNVLISNGTHDIGIERNILGPITVSRADYANIRGYNNTGAGNVARDNIGFGAPKLIRNTPENSTAEVGYGIADGGNNRFPVDPRYASTSCSGFVPREPLAFSAGHRSPVERVAGAGRVETSVALSGETFTRPGSTDTVLIARADAYPDALAGAALAAKLHAPVLLTGSQRLHSATAAEVRRLGADTAYLLGGRAALSDAVAKDLQAAGVRTVERIAGDNRFDTAAKVATLVGGDHVYVVEGANRDPMRGWPDAVAVSSLAAQTQRPILLVTRDDLPEPTRAVLAELDPDTVEVVGGTAAVSGSVEGQLEQAVEDATVTRTAGTSRYDTSLKLAEAAVAAGAKPGRTWLATGRNWPDALTAGPATAADGGLLLFVDGHNLDASGVSRDWVRRHAGAIDRLHLVGGRGVIIPAVEDRLAGFLR